MSESQRRRCAGQVLMIVLLAIVLLAGIIFYVINVGDQVNRRVAMQNAADAAAISGASWMARSMNVIAMNNVACTRVLALIPILDSFPLSTKMAYEEVDAWTGRLDDQLKKGVPDSWIREGLQSLRDRMARQRDVLAPMHAYFNPGGQIGVPITPLTTWSIRGTGGSPPHGKLWQAAEAMDEFSQATLFSAPVLTQANAVRYGNLNEAEVAFIAPVLPELPAERTGYGDFENPVKRGRIPDHMYPQRLGPYDRLYKWRDYKYRDVRERDRLVPGTPGRGKIRGGSGNVNVAGRRRGRSARGTTANPNPHWTYRTVGRILMGYTVYGPYTWMLRRIHGYAMGWWQDRGYYPGELSDTYFHEYQRKVADIKLGYMWGSQSPRYIHHPQWRTDYPQCRAMAAAGARVNRTMFYLVEIRSKYPKDAPGWMTPGTYVTNGDLPIAMWVKGWKDPASWGIKQLNEWIWEDQYEYETTWDAQISIPHERDPVTGEEKWHKVYMVATYVFGGIDVGGEVEVTNPANFDNRNDLPSPVVMTHADGDYDMSQPHHDLGVRRKVFTYLGIASKADDAMVWPGRFGSGNPFRGVMAVGQAEIFNTTSWDTWTQDWKAQMVPVTDWRTWTDVLTQGETDAADTAGFVDPEVVTRIREYFSRLDEQLVEAMLHH